MFAFAPNSVAGYESVGGLRLKNVAASGLFPTVAYMYITLAPKVLHKIYIEINVYFMQDF